MPGHREGDLIIGKKNLTAIGTLVERTTGYTMLLHLPDGYKAEQVRDAVAAKIQTLPTEVEYEQAARNESHAEPGERLAFGLDSSGHREQDEPDDRQEKSATRDKSPAGHARKGSWPPKYVAHCPAKCLMCGLVSLGEAEGQ